MLAGVGQWNILHDLVFLLSGFLILALIVQVLLSMLSMVSGLEFLQSWWRFVRKLTNPIMSPITKRMPSLSLGMFDLSTTIALLFLWWFISELANMLYFVLPAGW